MTTRLVQQTTASAGLWAPAETHSFTGSGLIRRGGLPHADCREGNGKDFDTKMI